MIADLCVRAETAADWAAVAEVHRQAFGQEEEANLVQALHAGGFARVALVAETAGRVVGHVLFSAMGIVQCEREVAALALAPLGVLPAYQSQGIGSALVVRGLTACREQGHRIVLVLGHAHYYPRFGFSVDMAARIESPFSRESFMALELAPGALAGVQGRVRYATPFGVA